MFAENGVFGDQHFFDLLLRRASYITSSMTSSRMARRPLAPVFWVKAFRAMAPNAPSVNLSFTFSKERSFSYCLVRAFLGSVRILHQGAFIELIQGGDDR